MPKSTVLIVVEQPWQLELGGKLALELRSLGEQHRLVLAVTDYFTFLHEPQILSEAIEKFHLDGLYSLESVYRNWQKDNLPDDTIIDTQLSFWEKSHILSRSLNVLEKTNQLVFGWERNYFYLPISKVWRKQILLDSIRWSEDVLLKENPDLVVAIERNTLCNSLIFELSMNLGIDHITFIQSRLGERWIPHENFGLGLIHPLHRKKTVSEDACDRESCPEHSQSTSQQVVTGVMYQAAAQSLQEIMNLRFNHRLPYFFGRSMGPEVCNLKRWFKQVFVRLRYRKKLYAFPVRRIEQNLIRLSVWELRQVFYYSMRLLGFRLWGSTAAPSTNYLLWALHSRPEDSTAVLGFGEDELEQIKKAVSQFPAGLKLLVKEHPIMFGTRKRSFYKSLKHLPGVVLVDCFTDTRNLLLSQYCLGSIGISGTILLEAELAGKKAFAFGSPEFAPHLSHHGETFSQFLASLEFSDDIDSAVKAKRYLENIEKNSTKSDVRYLGDLSSDRVKLMLQHWSRIIYRRMTCQTN